MVVYIFVGVVDLQAASPQAHNLVCSPFTRRGQSRLQSAAASQPLAAPRDSHTLVAQKSSRVIIHVLQSRSQRTKTKDNFTLLCLPVERSLWKQRYNNTVYSMNCPPASQPIRQSAIQSINYTFVQSPS